MTQLDTQSNTTDAANDAEDDPGGVPEWVVTYGDMMSLLLTFFIMLVSMSEVRSDSGKTRSALDAIREAFGPTKAAFGAPGRSVQSNSAFDKRSSKGVRSEDGMEKAGRDSQGAAGKHKAVERISQGTQVTLGGPAQFRRFDARLTDELKRNLDIMARVLARKTNQIMIRGHASPEPLPTNRDFAAAAVGTVIPWPKRQPRPFLHADGLELRDQFDLSFARARAVAEYLISRRINRRRLIVTAAGDTEQRLQTRRRDGQTLNRRVDVFLIDSYITRPQSSR